MCVRERERGLSLSLQIQAYWSMREVPYQAPTPSNVHVCDYFKAIPSSLEVHITFAYELQVPSNYFNTSCRETVCLAIITLIRAHSNFQTILASTLPLFSFILCLTHTYTLKGYNLDCLRWWGQQQRKFRHSRTSVLRRLYTWIRPS